MAKYEFADHVEKPLVLSDFEYLPDIGVMDACRETGLVQEKVNELRFLGEVWMDDLEGDQALEPRESQTSGHVDARHASGC
jgi:hypothetical protein